jgi:hypothetical protein
MAGDPYDIKGFDRNDIKLGMVIALNAGRSPKGIGSGAAKAERRLFL